MAKDPADPGTLELPLGDPACPHDSVERTVLNGWVWTCSSCSRRLTDAEVQELFY